MSTLDDINASLTAAVKHSKLNGQFVSGGGNGSFSPSTNKQSAISSKKADAKIPAAERSRQSGKSALNFKSTTGDGKAAGKVHGAKSKTAFKTQPAGAGGLKGNTGNKALNIAAVDSSVSWGGNPNRGSLTSHVVDKEGNNTTVMVNKNSGGKGYKVQVVQPGKGEGGYAKQTYAATAASPKAAVKLAEKHIASLGNPASSGEAVQVFVRADQ